MSSANVHSTQALQELKAALQQYSAETQAAMTAANAEIQRTQAWLAERLAHWQRECRQREAVVREAATLLARCQATRDRDRPIDCSRYAEALRQAEGRLREAVAELQTVQRWMGQIQQSVQQTELQMRRLVVAVAHELPKANALLEGMLGALAGYSAISVAGSGLGAGQAASISVLEAENITSHNAGTPDLADWSFQDAHGHTLTMRIYPANDQYYLRIFNRAIHPDLPESASTGDAGYANLHFERDNNRVRLQDILVPPSYRTAGIGNGLLEKVETMSRQLGVREIYGDAPDDEVTREWYERRGYHFRHDGRELYKTLQW